jgi:fructuronate reductase
MLGQQTLRSVHVPRLSRATHVRRPAAPPRILHLGLGNFFRAHPCWYTDHAPDGADWGITAFTGRGSQQLAGALNNQQGLYTLIARGPDADEAEILGCLLRAHPGDDHERWLRDMSAPDLAVVTVTVTEAGYLRGRSGGLDTARPEVRAARRRRGTGPHGARQAGGGPGRQAPRRSGPGRARTAG